MKDSRKKSNDDIRRMVKQGQISVVDGELTNSEMNRLFRGETLKEIKASRKAKPLTTAQTVEALALAKENPGMTWSEAQNRVREQPAKSKADMNTLLRSGRGVTVETEEDTK